MVRTFLLFACAFSLFFCIASSSYAVLIDNGDGTVTQVRSDGTKLMWTQDTLLAGDSGLPENKKNWNEAKLWAANLDFAGYSDWRLPRTPGTTTNGISTEGELGYLYNSELGELKNPEAFKMSDTHNNVFWTETELNETTVFIINFGNFKGKYSYSYQQTCSVDDNRQAWAVRDATNDVPGAKATAAAEVAETTEAATETKVEEVAAEVEGAAVKESTTVSANVPKAEPAVEGNTTEAVAVKPDVAADVKTVEPAKVPVEPSRL